MTEKVSSTFADNIVRAILRNPNVRLYAPQYHFHLITQDPDDNKYICRLRHYRQRRLHCE